MGIPDDHRIGKLKEQVQETRYFLKKRTKKLLSVWFRASFRSSTPVAEGA
jgi:hypothetical protein